MTKISSFLFEFFQHELSNSVFGNTMHENLERCKQNLTSYSSPKTTENPPPLLISQEWPAMARVCGKTYELPCDVIFASSLRTSCDFREPRG